MASIDPPFQPSPLVPILEGKMKAIKGIYIMSPWANLSAVGGSFEENGSKDLLPVKTYQDWGTIVLSPSPSEHRNFIEVRLALPT